MYVGVMKPNEIIRRKRSPYYSYSYVNGHGSGHGYGTRYPNPGPRPPYPGYYPRPHPVARAAVVGGAAFAGSLVGSSIRNRGYRG